MVSKKSQKNLSIKSNSSKYQKQKIYISDILPLKSSDILEENLKNIFSNFGLIIDIKILQNNYKKWYGFITFENDDSVKKILKNKILFQGKILKIRRAKNPKLKKKTENFLKNSKKLFLGGIPCQVKKNEIYNYFSKFGKIIDLCLPLKDKKKFINKGYGFVTFQNSTSVENVVKNFKKHFLRGKWIEIKIAKPRGDLSPNFKAFVKKDEGFVKENVFGFKERENRNFDDFGFFESDLESEKNFGKIFGKKILKKKKKEKKFFFGFIEFEK